MTSAAHATAGGANAGGEQPVWCWCYRDSICMAEANRNTCAPAARAVMLLDEAARRAVDLVVSAAGILLVSPLLLVLACIVKATSPGPALYVQRRVGRRGRPFGLIKLRSMTATSGGPQITKAGDVRITRVGRFLRATKLDELPQLINVLMGHMSLVGPRAEVPKYVELYTPEQRRVLDAKPGITGPAQVQYIDEERILAASSDPEATYVNEILPAKLSIDLEYLRSRTVLSDLRILAVTLFRLVRRG